MELSRGNKFQGSTKTLTIKSMALQKQIKCQNIPSPSHNSHYTGFLTHIITNQQMLINDLQKYKNSIFYTMQKI